MPKKVDKIYFDLLMQQLTGGARTEIHVTDEQMREALAKVEQQIVALLSGQSARHGGFVQKVP